MTSDAMYADTKAIAEKIIDRMALQSPPTYHVAFQRLENFYDALNSGNVVDFAEQNIVPFPGLSQVSSVGAARLSQMAFAADTPPSGSSADAVTTTTIEDSADAETAPTIKDGVLSIMRLMFKATMNMARTEVPSVMQMPCEAMNLIVRAIQVPTLTPMLLAHQMTPK